MAARQYVITPAAGKRLIGKALVAHPAIASALRSGTVAIIAGTTNGYVAEEVLASLGQGDAFDRSAFYRGITLPPSRPVPAFGPPPTESTFPGDVIIAGGVWKKGKTIFDVADDLGKGDVILKGANALDAQRNRAAVLIGHPKAGTIGVALQAVVGRRVRLILPVGLEKRVTDDLDDIATLLNGPDAEGPRLLPVPGEPFTEVDAISLLTGAVARQVAGGGVGGAEGSVWLAVSGNADQLDAADGLINSAMCEPEFEA